MANTTDFITAVYDELARLLGVGEANPSIVMQMAWPGYALNPSDFRRSDDPNGPYDPDVAREAVSQLANIAPAFSRARFENSGFEVDDLYEIVLTSAIPQGATPETVGTNPIYRLFSDAQYELSQARRGVHDDPNGYYYPASATPNNWYDEAAVPTWGAITLGSTQVQPAATNSSFVRSGGLELAKQTMWRMKPSASEAAALKSTLLEKNVAKATALKRSMTPTATPTLPTGLKRQLNPSIPTKVPAAAATKNLPRSELFTRSALPSNALKGATVDLGRFDALRRDLGVVDLKQRLTVKTALDRTLPTKPPSPATDGFSVSFKFCRVALDRPWLKLALLSTRNWWMFDNQAGTYSTGEPDNNPGMFPLLTQSFIAIRDLKITANWSQEDRQNLGNAASFGPFDLREATINSNTIEVKGLQIIAFISRVMPKLPPLSPP